MSDGFNEVSSRVIWWCCHWLSPEKLVDQRRVASWFYGSNVSNLLMSENSWQLVLPLAVDDGAVWVRWNGVEYQRSDDRVADEDVSQNWRSTWVQVHQQVWRMSIQDFQHNRQRCARMTAQVWPSLRVDRDDLSIECFKPVQRSGPLQAHDFQRAVLSHHVDLHSWLTHFKLGFIEILQRWRPSHDGRWWPRWFGFTTQEWRWHKRSNHQIAHTRQERRLRLIVGRPVQFHRELQSR